MILHVDMDAFYASVEERENPALRGKPLIVGGSAKGRGVVSAANYVARRFGIHSAMPTSRAMKLCPHAEIVRPRMNFYSQVSKQIREIFLRFTPEIEPLSLDEAFLDVRGSQQLFGSAEEIGRQIKDLILQELHLVASVGVAPNKFLAKLASDLEKPDGFTVIPADRVQERLDPLSVSRIWGVGKVTLRRFQKHGITTFEQLRRLGLEQARILFGNHGEHFWKLSQGLDSRTVVSERKAKSISHETTFATDVDDEEVLHARMLELTESVAARMRTRKIQGRTINIKLRYSDFHTITRAYSLDRPSHATDILWKAASSLLAQAIPTRKLAIRLVGMGVTNLEATKPTQLQLFDAPSGPSEQELNELDFATDAIREKFGASAICRGVNIGRHMKNRKS